MAMTMLQTSVPIEQNERNNVEQCHKRKKQISGGIKLTRKQKAKDMRKKIAHRVKLFYNLNF